MIVMAILIVFILIGLQDAGSDAADEIAQGKYGLDGSDGSKCCNQYTVEMAQKIVNILNEYLPRY